MTLIAETTEGMHNLFRLSSLASLEGYYRKPRFDRELLERYGKGLIATTGCPSGEVNRWLQAGEYDRACTAAADFRDIFGPDNFFVELMDHGLGIESRHRGELLKIADELQLPLLATNDLHYVRPEDADTHDVLLCIGTRTTMDDPKRFRFDGRDFYLKSGQEMREVWRDLPEACDNTLLIAERCNVEFGEGANLMPTFPVPPGSRRSRGWSRRLSAVWQPGSRRVRCRSRIARRQRMRSASSARWASPATSWSPLTWCATRRRTASGSDRAAGRRLVR